MSEPSSDPESLLNGTPYLVGDGEASRKRFATVSRRALRTHGRAQAAAQSIHQQAQGTLVQFDLAIRSDLVAESNKIEGINSSAAEVRQLAEVKQDLLAGDVGAFVEHIRDDARLFESLGLLRAYTIADEWSREGQRPREFELRALHGLVMPALPSAGSYKSEPNEIERSELVTTDPWDVQREMGELASWFVTGTGDPVLDATIVHAWLTHIHPFDDGNGRMARLLANMALVQARFPPLLLRSVADRGQYLDALAASDEGDILPLYDLFNSALRRVVKTMEDPRYVESRIRGRLLASVDQRYQAWFGCVRGLVTSLDHRLKMLPWRLQTMGFPSVEDFSHLENRNSEGNCWFMKLRNLDGREWLLFFGYRSDDLMDLMGKRRPWPSIFFSERTEDPAFVHPYEPRFQSSGIRPAEIALTPGCRRPAVVRWGYETEEMHIDEVVGVLCRWLGDAA